MAKTPVQYRQTPTRHGQTPAHRGGAGACRIVKLVLGDVGLEFRRRLWEKEDEENERFERGTGQWI